MTRKKADAPASEANTTDDAATIEMPNAGGSWVRQADGSLKRVEFTEESQPDGDAEDAPTAVDGEASEGGETGNG